MCSPLAGRGQRVGAVTLPGGRGGCRLQMQGEHTRGGQCREALGQESSTADGISSLPSSGGSICPGSTCPQSICPRNIGAGSVPPGSIGPRSAGRRQGSGGGGSQEGLQAVLLTPTGRTMQFKYSFLSAVGGWGNSAAQPFPLPPPPAAPWPAVLQPPPRAAGPGRAARAKQRVPTRIAWGGGGGGVRHPPPPFQPTPSPAEPGGGGSTAAESVDSAPTPPRRRRARTAPRSPAPVPQHHLPAAAPRCLGRGGGGGGPVPAAPRSRHWSVSRPSQRRRRQAVAALRVLPLFVPTEPSSAGTTRGRGPGGQADTGAAALAPSFHGTSTQLQHGLPGWVLPQPPWAHGWTALCHGGPTPVARTLRPVAPVVRQTGLCPRASLQAAMPCCTVVATPGSARGSSTRAAVPRSAATPRAGSGSGPCIAFPCRQLSFAPPWQP